MVDLNTTYLGLKLKNPLVASASPLSEKVETVLQLEQAGIAAVVMYSLFEEQIIHDHLELDHYLSYSAFTSAEASTYLPDVGKYTLAPQAYVEHLHRIKQAVKIPVIGSLNGVSTGGWIDYAREIQQAGADALELNIYYLPTDLELTGSQLEDNYVSLVSDIRSRIDIPIAVKLGPFFTALPNLARRLAQAGANGLVLFNRFYQPDFDLQELKVVPHLELSTSHELRLPLRWIAILHGRVDVDFALTSGVHTSKDLIKALLAGASVAMTASEMLQNGMRRVPEMLDQLRAWMEEHEYESVSQMKGAMSQKAVGVPNAFERSNYMKVLNSYSNLP